MPTHHPKLPPPPKPIKIFFDPFNSSSTGHQTAPNLMSGSTSWRDSRAYKLSHQFSDVSGYSGSQHRSDLVGAGSEHYKKDGRKDNGDWEKGAPGLRENGWQDIRDLMRGSRKRSSTSDNSEPLCKKRSKTGTNADREKVTTQTVSDVQKDSGTSDLKTAESNLVHGTDAASSPPQPPQIFRDLTMYMNGSTAPLVSDHRLKQLFATHGGNSSLGLGRRTVTHVILGKTYGAGLAASKIHKEVTLVGGKGIKFVTAQWVLDSIEKGVRQPEGRYQPATISSKIGGSGQKSVAGLFPRVIED